MRSLSDAKLFAYANLPRYQNQSTRSNKDGMLDANAYFNATKSVWKSVSRAKDIRTNALNTITTDRRNADARYFQ